jgi:hypothetical protein
MEHNHSFVGQDAIEACLLVGMLKVDVHHKCVFNLSVTRDVTIFIFGSSAYSSYSEESGSLKITLRYTTLKSETVQL